MSPNMCKGIELKHESSHYLKQVFVFNLNSTILLRKIWTGGLVNYPLRITQGCQSSTFDDFMKLSLNGYNEFLDSSIDFCFI